MAEVAPRMIVLKRENERLREQLAQSDQLVEWLSKENAALARQMERLVPQLNEINDKARVITEWVQWAEPEIKKWRERYFGLELELATTNKVKEEVAAHARKLEAKVKGLTGRPGTISIGEGGVYILGFGTPSQEVLDAAESLRAEHFRNMEDEWYSCPKSGHCWNDLMPDVCTCGADDANVAVDLVLAYLRGEAT